MATTVTAKPGRQLLLKVSTGPSPTIFVTVGGLRNVQLNVNNNPVDITNAASNGFREWLGNGGVQSLSVSCDGIFDATSQGSDLLVAAAINRASIQVQVISGHGDQFVTDAVVNGFGRSGPVEGVETFSCQLESSGTVIYIP